MNVLSMNRLKSGGDVQEWRRRTRRLPLNPVDECVVNEQIKVWGVTYKSGSGIDSLEIPPSVHSPSHPFFSPEYLTCLYIHTRTIICTCIFNEKNTNMHKINTHYNHAAYVLPYLKIRSTNLLSISLAVWLIVSISLMIVSISLDMWRNERHGYEEFHHCELNIRYLNYKYSRMMPVHKY